MKKKMMEPYRTSFWEESKGNTSKMIYAKKGIIVDNLSQKLLNFLMVK